MSDTAFQTQYRQEFIAGFEQRQSLLRESVTTEVQVKGNTAVFLVADSGDAEATTRGTNGNIPGRPDNLEQYSCVLKEWHDVPERTRFNIFASQGDGKRIMQETSQAVMNRQIDQDIIEALSTATINTGATQTATLQLVNKARVILANNEVPISDGQVTALITPAFEAYLLGLPEFASHDYVRKQPLDTGETGWKDEKGYYMWLGVRWIVHTRLPGRGTNAEKCFMYHKSAIGHAAPTEALDTLVGYDGRHDKSWCRVSGFMGSKLLQNAGVVVINHDGTAFAAS